MSGDNPDDRDDTDNGDDRDDATVADSSPSDISAVEKAIMLLSAVFTVALFGFAISQAFVATGPAEPTVQVTDDRTGSDGSVIYSLTLYNRDDVGLISATVEANCTDPPAELVFENVPARGTRKGTVVCPAGTRDPAVSVTTWVRE